MTYPHGGASWMQDNLSWLSQYPVEDVLCILGSHDAGMSITTHTSFLATSEQIQTQTKTITEQLMYGTRWFDIRPMSWEGTWYCGHYSHLGLLGWQGGTGLKLMDVIDQVNLFTAKQKELVVLRITHVYDAKTGTAVSYELKRDLVQLLHTRLHNVRQDANVNSSMTSSLGNLIQDRACVLIRYSGVGRDDGQLVGNRTLNRQEIYDANFNMGDYSITPAQSVIEAVFTSSIFKGTILDRLFGRSTLSLVPDSLRARLAKAPQMLLASADGRTNATKARALHLDDIRDDIGLNICVAASAARWYTNEYQKNGFYDQTIILYGGKRIEDEIIVEQIRKLIAEQKRFQISNDLLGYDPWPGHRKSCCVLYSELRVDQHGERVFWRGRIAREREDIDFTTS